MDHICMVVPVLPGKSAAARAFMHQLDGARRGEYDASERRIGVSKEVWFLASLPSGDQMIGYLESADFNRALTMFIGSRDPFDMWFKAEVQGATGLDLNNPPADLGPAELLSNYSAARVAGV
jgi:hypothetical protein